MSTGLHQGRKLGIITKHRNTNDSIWGGNLKETIYLALSITLYCVCKRPKITLINLSFQYLILFYYIYVHISLETNKETGKQRVKQEKWHLIWSAPTKTLNPFASGKEGKDVTFLRFISKVFLINIKFLYLIVYFSFLNFFN